jgi:hypothetical protein
MRLSVRLYATKVASKAPLNGKLMIRTPADPTRLKTNFRKSEFMARLGKATDGIPMEEWPHQGPEGLKKLLKVLPAFVDELRFESAKLEELAAVNRQKCSVPSRALRRILQEETLNPKQSKEQKDDKWNQWAQKFIIPCGIPRRLPSRLRQPSPSIPPPSPAQQQ